MKTLTRSAVVAVTFSAIFAPSSLASSSSQGHRLVNAYGEPAGFGNPPEVIIPISKEMYFNRALPGLGGLFLFPGYVDRRNFEPLGVWQERSAAEARGTVTIGPLEVLDSGPTGPLTPSVLEAAREEVTAQVLDRIKATDRKMKSLKSLSKSLGAETQMQFKTAAREVAEHRAALRESLKVVRASGSEDWPQARTAVAVNFNAYVQSLHRAEAAAAGMAKS